MVTISPKSTSKNAGDMDGNVIMSFFESTILSDEVKIISSDDDSSGHLLFSNNTGQNSASNSDVSGEWTFLINKVSLLCVSGRLESESDVSNVFFVVYTGTALLWVVRNSWLALEGPLSLCHFR